MLLTHNGVAWLDRLTNLASSVRTEVGAVRNRLTKETTQLGSLGWDRGRGRSDVLDDAPSGGWVEIKLTEAETGTIFNHPIVRAGDGRFSSDDCRLGRDISVEVPIDRRIEQWTVTTLPR